MNEHEQVICQVRDSFSGLHMDMPVESVFARSRARRRHQLSGLTAAGAATAGAAVAVTLTLGLPPSTGSGHRPASPGPVRLAAFSVTSGPGHSTTLSLRQGQRLDAAALRRALARRGIPALVTVGTFCRTAGGVPGAQLKVVHPLGVAGGSDKTVIAETIPAGTRLSIGYFQHYVRMALIKDGAPLVCSGILNQPAVHIPPSGPAIRN
jgi:hypothetical protein